RPFFTSPLRRTRTTALFPREHRRYLSRIVVRPAQGRRRCIYIPLSKRLRMDKNRFEQDTQLLLEQDELATRKKRRGRWFLVLLVLGGRSYGAYRWWRVDKPAAADATTGQSAENPGGRGRGGRGGRGGGGRPAVVTIPARKTDMPVYLRGLGTVGAFN